MNRIDIKGKRFHRLLVLEYVWNGHWRCICDCGTVKNISGTSIRRGQKSCGCYMREAVSKRRRDPRGFAGVVYNDYLRNAKKWNREFRITFTTFAWLIQQNCHYCGVAPMGKSRPVHGNWRYNGLDRVDNAKGYVLDNVVAACKVCNRMKDNLSYQEFLGGIRAVYEYRHMNAEKVA